LGVLRKASVNDIPFTTNSRNIVAAGSGPDFDLYNLSTKHEVHVYY
jgi:hypothetical protein